MKLFYMNVWVYLWDRPPYTDHHERRLALQPEAQFNTHADQQPTFEITYFWRDEVPEVVEQFFIDVYDKMNCGPYGD